MASGNGSRIAIQLGLSALVVVLAVILFRSIVLPYQAHEESLAEQALVRERMSDVRSALISYRDAYDGYPATLDSLGLFVRQDTAFTREDGADAERAAPFSADEITRSPRTGTPFNYALASDSTTTIYWLQDPDVPEDSIGSREPNPALRNAASWE